MTTSYDVREMTYDAYEDDACKASFANDDARAADAGDDAGDARARARRRTRGKKRRRNDDFDVKRGNASAVYVSGLPSDVTESEIAETFKKCGVIKVDDATGRARVKCYRDDEGRTKGDALVVFLKHASVDLAITLLDQTTLRAWDESTMMTVRAATFEMKAEKTNGREGDASTSTSAIVVKKLTKDERKRAAAALKKQEAAALGWDGFDDAVEMKKVIVVLKHMFSLEDVFADVNLRKELEEDVMEEAQKCGPVMSIRSYVTSKDGVMSLRFKTIEGAENCLRRWNGRWFDGRQIEAALWDGRSRFGVDDESAVAQAERLEAYGEEIAGDGASDDDDDDDDEE